MSAERLKDYDNGAGNGVTLSAELSFGLSLRHTNLTSTSAVAITVSKEAARSRRTDELPQLFGRGGRDRVLVCLAVNGPMTVREIGRAIGSDSRKAFDMVERLSAAGLVVKRDRAGGRKYVALNRRLRIHRLLRDLLLELDRHWPASRVGRTTNRWAMWTDDGTMDADRLDRVFFSPVRSRVLTLIAAVGRLDMTTLVSALGIGSVSALYAVNHWERFGIVRSEHVGRHRYVSLDPEFVAARGLRMLLREIVAGSAELRGLRSAVRAKDLQAS